MNLLDLANAALAQFEGKTTAPTPAPDPGDPHRHWSIHFPDREPVEVIFVPGIKHKTVLLVYPKAVAAEPITDELDGDL